MIDRPGSHISYVNCLKAHATRYLTILESILGPRDPRFLFQTIGPSDECYPRTHFPECFHFEGNCRVDILIGKWPWDNLCQDQGPWQVAHECVHLLDPVREGSANVLEEGLATWFQNEPRHHSDELVRCYAENQKPSPNYANAEKLVRSGMPEIINAVKTLRTEKGIRIHEIEAEMLKSLLPSMGMEALKRLCVPFI